MRTGGSCPGEHHHHLGHRHHHHHHHHHHGGDGGSCPGEHLSSYFSHPRDHFESGSQYHRPVVRNTNILSNPRTAHYLRPNISNFSRTPQSAINAMSALQGMLGINQVRQLVRFDNNNDNDIQGNLASMLSANSSMQNINGSVPNMHQVDRRHHCHNYQNQKKDFWFLKVEKS